MSPKGHKVIAIDLNYLPEVKDKSLLIKSPHTLDIGFKISAGTHHKVSSSKVFTATEDDI